jgi:RimJ/RimL family protein N-acetyltransferase
LSSVATQSATLIIRRAVPDDAERLWQWRNDPETRRASRNTDEVPLEQHMRWFEGGLSRKDRVLLIAEADGEPVGTVRFDMRDDDYLEVSINVAPQARGKKMSAACLGEACNFVLAHGPIGFHAAIRHDNAASIRIFRQCGFVDFGREDGFVLLRRHPDAQAGPDPDTGSGDV